MLDVDAACQPQEALGGDSVRLVIRIFATPLSKIVKECYKYRRRDAIPCCMFSLCFSVYIHATKKTCMRQNKEI